MNSRFFSITLLPWPYVRSLISCPISKFGEDYMTGKKVLVIGGGGREDALAWKLSQSPQVADVFVAPGNGGTVLRGFHQIPFLAKDIDSLVRFVRANGIDLTVVGPEEPLVIGIADAFADAGLRIVGPTRLAAQLEASKVFGKHVLESADVPTADFSVFSDFARALDYMRAQSRPLVVKASGLAAGKGAIVCENFSDAQVALQRIMLDREFGDAGNQVVIEERLHGREISLTALCDHRDFVAFPASQDHKRAFDEDVGPNTGGMGAIAPVPWLPREDEARIVERVVAPTLDELVRLGRSYSGFLYPGLMVTEGLHPSVLEFNVRLGDPEAQVLMRLFASDLFELLWACTEKNPSQAKVRFHTGFAVCVVLASAGYPGAYEHGKLITGSKNAERIPDVVVFHAGTFGVGSELFTAGGRVLHVTATGDSLLEARGRAYDAVRCIKFEGMQFRKDIGEKALAGFDR